jgi:cytochrome c2
MADYRYSRALRDSGITWTAEALDTFIATPRRRCLPTACRTRECRTLLIVPI